MTIITNLFERMFASKAKKTPFYVILTAEGAEVYNKNTNSFERAGAMFYPQHLFELDEEVCTVAHDLENKRNSFGNYVYRNIKIETLIR